MKYTGYYKMNLPEGADVVDITVLDENFSKLDKLISDLDKKLNDISKRIFDSLYAQFFVNYADYPECEDISDYDISYEQWTIDGNEASSSAMIITDTADLPDKNASAVFFVSFISDNDDEINVHQALLYPNGDVYVRTKTLWDYIKGEIRNPSYGEWELNGTYANTAKQYFKSTV